MGIGIALVVQGEREHRFERRHERGREGAEEARHLAQVRRRHRDGPLHRRRHRRHPARDHRRVAGADRHRPDLPGAHAGEERQQAHRRGHDRHARAPGSAGRRLLHDPLRRARRVPPAREGPHHRHRLARRLDHGAVDDREPQAEPVLHALRQGPRDLREVRRDRSAPATASAPAASPTRATRRSSPS